MSQEASDLNQLALSELAGLLLATETFEELMQQIARLAARTIPGATTCGITFAENKHVVTVGSADPLARLLDEQQYELDDGPCLQALDTARVVSAPDLRHEARWDGYPARALTNGIEAVYSSPLLVHDRAIGVLNVYADRAHAFDPSAQQTIAQLTSMTAATVTAALRHYDEATLTDHLRNALSSRSVIDQAMGIIMATQRCTPKAAFDILRTVSQNRNIPLREIAAELVDRTATSPAAPSSPGAAT